MKQKKSFFRYIIDTYADNRFCEEFIRLLKAVYKRRVKELYRIQVIKATTTIANNLMVNAVV